MSDVEISKVLKSLHDNLVNEIENQLGGSLDDSTSKLADALITAVKDTYNEHCEPSDRID